MEPEGTDEAARPSGVAYITGLYDFSLALLWLVHGSSLLDLVGMLPVCAGGWVSIGPCVAIALLHIVAAVGIVRLKRWGLYAQASALGVDVLMPAWLAPWFLVLWTLPAAVGLAFWLWRPRQKALRGMAGLVLLAATGINTLAATATAHVNRPAWTSAAVGDLRALIVAEETYKGMSGGFYGSLECLARPGQCLRSAAGSSPQPLLMGDDLPRYDGPCAGYRRTFHAGPSADAVSSSGARLVSFACIAVPLRDEANQPRACYSFCADSSATICVAPAGQEPRVIDGRCDLSTCKPLS